MNKNPKIILRVIREPYDYTVKRRIHFSSDGTKAEVVVEPPTKKTAGWTVNVLGKIRREKKGYYATAIYGQTEAVAISIPENKYLDHAWTTDDIKQFAEMNVFKARYGKLLGDLIAAIKPYLIVLAIIVVAAVALSAYNVYALSKIPEQIVQIIPQNTPTPTPPFIG